VLDGRDVACRLLKFGRVGHDTIDNGAEG
jgi:hypothetical protein